MNGCELLLPGDATFLSNSLGAAVCDAAFVLSSGLIQSLEEESGVGLSLLLLLRTGIDCCILNVPVTASRDLTTPKPTFSVLPDDAAEGVEKAPPAGAVP